MLGLEEKGADEIELRGKRMGTLLKAVRSKTSRRRSPFTLIELLVVIGIVALLVSLLLPALGKAKEFAWRTQCSGNLRQVALSINSYADETVKGCLPPLYTGSFKAPRWFDWLSAWLPSGKSHHLDLTSKANRYNFSFFCPSEKSHHPSLVDYGLNAKISEGTPKRLTQILKPSGTVMLGDSREYSSSYTTWWGAWYIKSGFASYYGTSTQCGPWPPRHGNSMNFAFVDGHAGPLDVSTAACVPSLSSILEGQ